MDLSEDYIDMISGQEPSSSQSNLDLLEEAFVSSPIPPTTSVEQSTSKDLGDYLAGGAAWTGEQIVDTADLMGGLASGMAMFPVRLGANLLGRVVGGIDPQLTSKEVGEFFESGVDKYATLHPGWLHSMVYGEELEGSPAVKSSELVGKAFELAVPSEKLYEQNRQNFKDIGMNEGVADNLAYIQSKITELALFGLYHRAGSTGYKALNERLARVNEKAKAGDAKGTIDAANELLKDFKEKEEFKDVRKDAEELQIFKDLEAQREAKKPTFEQREEELAAGRERMQPLETKIDDFRKSELPPAQQAAVEAAKKASQTRRERLEAKRVDNYVDRIISGEKMDSNADLQFYDNNSEAIEAALQKAYEDRRIPLAEEIGRKVEEVINDRQNVEGLRSEELKEEEARKPVQDETSSVEEASESGVVQTPQEVAEEPTPIVKNLPKEEPTPKPKRSVPNYETIDDAKYDYDFYGKKEFATQRAANKYLGTKRILKYREELQANGLDLEVIKVGGKYRLAEALKMTEEEMAAFEKAFEDIYRERNVETKPELTPEKVIENLIDTDKQLRANEISLEEAESSFIDLYRRATAIKDERIIEGAQRGLEYVRNLQKEKVAEREASLKPRPSKEDPTMIVGEKWPNGFDGEPIEVIFNADGAPFKNPIIAVDYMKAKGIKGVVGSAPEGEGYVIERVEPKKLKFTTDAEKIDMTKKELKEADEIDKLFIKAHKSIFDVFDEFLKSEEGSWDLDATARAARTIVEKAAKAGMRVREYLEALELSPEKIVHIEEKIKLVLAKSPDMKESYKEGEAVNWGKMERKTRSGETVRRQVVTKGQLDALRSMEKMKVADAKSSWRRAGQKFSREHVPTVFLVDELKSQYAKDLHSKYWESVDTINREFKEVKDKLDAVSKGLKNESFRRIGLRALWEQENIRGRMKKAGWKEEQIPILTAEEERVYRFMRDELETIGNETRSTMADNGFTPYKMLDNYFTIMYSEGAAMRELGLNTMMDPRESVAARERQFKSKYFGSTKNRSYEGLKAEMELNAKKVFTRYMRNAIEYKTTLPLITELNEIRGKLKTGRKIDKINAKGKKVIKDEYYLLRKDNPGADEFFRRWSNQIAGRDPDAVFAMSKENRGLENKIRRVSGNIAGSLMSFLVRSGPVQVTALRNTVAEVGWIRTAQGILELTMLGKVREAWRESPLLRTSMSEPDFKAMFGTGKVFKVGRNIGTAHIRAIDFLTRTASYLAFREKFRSEGLRGKRLVQESERAMARTQATGLTGDLPGVQRSAVGKAIYLLQTFTINDWNYLYKNTLGVGSDMSMSRRAKTIFNYAVATSLFNMLFEDVLNVQSPFPTPIKEVQKGLEEDKSVPEIIKDVVFEILSPIPGLFGGLRYGSSPFGLTIETFSDLVLETAEGNFDKGIEASARIAGIPASRQIAKSARQISYGETNPYVVLMGSNEYPRKTKSYSNRRDRSSNRRVNRRTR